MNRPIKDHVSAGGLLLNKNNTHAYLIYKKSREQWQLPKGHQKEGETLEETALREIYEETGYKNIQLVGDINTQIEYDFELEREPEYSHHKIVYFFLAKLTNDYREENTQDKGENLGGDWVSLGKVVQNLSHAEEKNAAEKLLGKTNN
ncbi:MAG TPA: NUDIX domain-containing protein [candidate division WWE3 bacterium]|uniref:NUDIX domain-containing protein n=1 Tax=candidate division WWE3 bacterium TaxID=2053526 RepID=A0A7C1DM14_UNCKA|nr:NUDIX domain-containing protein [candidate division WWE3 bacterium]